MWAGSWANQLLTVCADLAVLAIAGLLSITLYLDGHLSLAAVAAQRQLLFAGAIFFVALFQLFGLHRRLWQYASVRDLIDLLRAGLLAGLSLALLPGIPAGLRALYWLLAMAGLTTFRFTPRMWREFTGKGGANRARRVLIAGAGDAGAALARELIRQTDSGLTPVGFVDDSVHKRGQSAYGLPIIGSCEDLAPAASRLGAHEVIIAMPSAPSDAIRRIWTEALAHRLSVRILPPLRDLSLRDRLMQQVRKVKLEDLLGRPEVKIDLQAVSAYLAGRTVLVTGAGGSIGSELSRQVALVGPSRLILVGHGENSLFEIDGELRRRFPQLEIHPVVADIQDRRTIDRVLEHYRPAVLFHAAAHKHVPLMERNPAEAIKNNILGTFHLASSAYLHGVERFVLISTDKAVNAASVMGASKRAAERMVGALAATSGTTFITVRFGNVLGSRGSVVPIFQRQIAAGGPVTITHPDATRYFMTIPEAARLVIQAGAMGRSGELFLLDMGEPVRVVDLARDLIRLAGLEPERQVQLAFTGLRPGEKLTEELYGADEQVSTTSHERIFRTGDGGVHLHDLTGAIDQFLAMTDGSEITPAAILAVLDEASKGAREFDGHYCELVHEPD